MSSSKQPNILFIQTDSMDGRAIGCMGHPALIGATPNIDSLARDGVMFRQAYCNNPISCPSRSSMWSGRFTHNCEAWNNYKGLEQDASTFQTYLEKAGYHSEICGSTDHRSGGHTVRARVSPWTRSANIPRPNYLMGPLVVHENENPRINMEDWTAVDKATKFLRERAAPSTAPQDRQPFFTHVNLNLPHPEFVTNHRFLNRIREENIVLPPVDQPDHPALAYQHINKNWPYGFDDDTIRQVRRIYYAMIAEVDDMVGEVLSALTDSGEADNTYIIFTSDHGEMAMEHRSFFKMSQYEASSHIPMIIKGPGLKKSSQVNTLISLIDLYPTFMDMAKTQGPDNLDGHSLLPELTGQPSERPDWIFSEFHGSSCNTGWFMLRQDQWKYMAFVGYQPKLFDLSRDPEELNNLATERPDIVAKMDQQMRDVVDYEKVDAKVKAYDRKAFGAWREERIEAGDYRELMSRVFSGWDYLKEGEGDPWTDEEEAKIVEWMKG